MPAIAPAVRGVEEGDGEGFESGPPVRSVGDGDCCWEVTVGSVVELVVGFGVGDEVSGRRDSRSTGYAVAEGDSESREE